MTPLQNVFFRALLKNRGKPDAAATLPMLARATAFDLTPIAALLEQAQGELATADRAAPIEHGGLVFPPAPVTWIERRGGHEARGALLTARPGCIQWTGWPRPHRVGLAGFLVAYEGPDGEQAIWPRYQLASDVAPVDPAAWLDWSLWVAASLLIINAPRGFRREEQPVHKGHDREARSAGLPELRVGYTIRLDDHRTPEARRAADPRSRQGLHFVRSHRRQLGPQRSALVRAHWKGSAEFGILIGDRLVKSGGRR